MLYRFLAISTAFPTANDTNNSIVAEFTSTFLFCSSFQQVFNIFWRFIKANMIRKGIKIFIENL